MSDKENATWWVVYADLITVLLCFFAIFYSQNTKTSGMWEKMKTGFNTTASIKEQSEFAAIVNILDDLKKNSERNSITYTVNRKGIEVNFAGNILFESGNADLNKDGTKILTILAKKFVSSIDFEYEMEIQGHTDSLPIQNSLYPSNWELSTARASKVVRFFISKGVNPRSVKAVGFAEHKPMKTEPGDRPLTPSQRLEHDRRVVILLNPRKD